MHHLCRLTDSELEDVARDLHGVGSSYQLLGYLLFQCAQLSVTHSNFAGESVYYVLQLRQLSKSMKQRYVLLPGKQSGNRWNDGSYADGALMLFSTMLLCGRLWLLVSSIAWPSNRRWYALLLREPTDPCLILWLLWTSTVQYFISSTSR